VKMKFGVLNVITDETHKLNIKIDVMNIIIFYFIWPLNILQGLMNEFTYRNI
jgi:hypothetical protein